MVYANNGNSVDAAAGGEPSRFRVVGQFVTNPYVEQGATKNRRRRPGGTNQLGEGSGRRTQQGYHGVAKKLYPAGTSSRNYWISVSGIRSDTGYERYATHPDRYHPENWKEH